MNRHDNIYRYPKSDSFQATSLSWILNPDTHSSWCKFWPVEAYQARLECFEKIAILHQYLRSTCDKRWIHNWDCTGTQIHQILNKWICWVIKRVILNLSCAGQMLTVAGAKHISLLGRTGRANLAETALEAVMTSSYVASVTLVKCDLAFAEDSHAVLGNHKSLGKIPHSMLLSQDPGSLLS